MYDPEELNAKIAKASIDQQKVEEEALALEKKILENYEVKKSMFPSRAYGQPYDSSKFSMTLKFLIEKHQPHVASYLGFNSGYHSRQAEIEEARAEATARMAKQVEELQAQNANDRKVREWRSARGVNVGTGNPIY